MLIDNVTVKTPETIDINLSEITVLISKIYQDKYLSYFVTREKVNIDIIEDDLLSLIKEFQLYQFLYAIDREKNLININYANLHYINSGNGIIMTPLLLLNTYIVSAKMHGIFNGATLTIFKKKQMQTSPSKLLIFIRMKLLKKLEEQLFYKIISIMMHGGWFMYV